MEQSQEGKAGAGLRAYRELHEEAFAENIREIRRLTAPDSKNQQGPRIMAVVKANAYGHGDVRTARILQEQGITDFAVATLEEGIRLREHQITGNILILGYTPPALLGTAFKYELTQTVVDAEYGAAAGRTAPGLMVHLKINTGMNRLGLNWDEREAIEQVIKNKSLNVQGIFSHLNMADGQSSMEKSFTELQIQRFTELISFLEQKGLCPPDRHLQSSYGILRGFIKGCNLVRPGIFLYGVHSSSAGKKAALHSGEEKQFHGSPALSIKASVALMRQVDAGEMVSYGPEYRTEKPMRLAVLTIGYGDGIPRSLSDGSVLLHGKRAPIVGRICMDQLVVDVSEIPEVCAGDTATLLGRDQNAEITAEELAEKAGTITNEFLCRLGERLPVLLDGDRQKLGGFFENLCVE